MSEALYQSDQHELASQEQCAEPDQGGYWPIVGDDQSTEYHAAGYKTEAIVDMLSY